MNKKEIAERLKEIAKIDSMSNEELMKKYKFLKEDYLLPESKYAYLAGIIRAEIDFLVRKIEGGEFYYGYQQEKE